MWNEVDIQADGVLGLECGGKLTKEDFERMHAWLDRELSNRAKPALVVFMDTFDGYEDVSAFWADLKVETTHVDDFSRIAIVADQSWIKWSAKAADPVTSAELKWFETEDREAAINWAEAT